MLNSRKSRLLQVSAARFSDFCEQVVYDLVTKWSQGQRPFSMAHIWMFTSDSHLVCLTVNKTRFNSLLGFLTAGTDIEASDSVQTQVTRIVNWPSKWARIWNLSFSSNGQRFAAFSKNLSVDYFTLTVLHSTDKFSNEPQIFGFF